MIETARGGYAVELWLSEDYAGGLQGDVERELAAELESARARGHASPMVEVHEGFVTLTGEVRSWAEKTAARRAVMRVPGVTGVDDGGVEVKPDVVEAKPDATLASLAQAALDADSRVPPGTVRVEAHDGCLTLQGTVGHEDERAAALDAVGRLIGVREVVNAMVVPARGSPSRLLTRVDEAVRRALGREGKHVRVTATEAGVEVTGRVPTLALQAEAARAVRRVLGDVAISLKFH
jgi:osmotically-inducible protein OsmY